VAVAGAVVGVRLLTELLDPSAYGQLALGMTAATLVQQTILGPLSNGAVRLYAPSREAHALSLHLAAVKRLVLQATAAIIGVAVIACLGLLLAGRRQWIPLTAAAVCFALLSGYNSVLNGMQNAARQRTVVAFHQGFASWARFLLAAALIGCLGAASSVAMLGYALAILAVLVSQRWFFLKTVRSECEPLPATEASIGQYRRQIVAYAWPFATWGLLGWAGLAADRWAIQVFASSHEVGLYAALFQLGYYPIFILQSMGTQLLAPIYFERAGDASDPARMLRVFTLGRRIMRLAILGTLVFAAACLFLHRGVFALFVAPEYAAMSKLLPAMVLAAGLTAAAQFGTILLHARKSTSSLIVPKNASSVLGVVLMLTGAAWYGIVGVVVARIVYAVVHLTWIGALVRRQHATVRTTTVAPRQGPVA
jgi:O-antigen/teichoic acid export membrane protein